MRHAVYFGDNLPILRAMSAESVDLIYIDPPFNTGTTQRRTQIRTTAVGDSDGDRTGFGGRRYATTTLGSKAYVDVFDDYLGFLEPRLIEAKRLLTADGTIYVHLDYRESHYVKVLLDGIFGRACFLNEVIWAYDYGGRGKRRWPAKHDTILVYVQDPDNYVFNWDEIERIPYLAPGLVGPEKAARGKVPTDTWFHTIVPTNGKEKTGYPTQKPVPILKRIVAASSPPDGTVLDFFAGSGTTGEACRLLGRRFVLVDDNPEALATMARRFAGIDEVDWVGFDPVACGDIAVPAMRGRRSGPKATALNRGTRLKPATDVEPPVRESR